MQILLFPFICKLITIDYLFTFPSCIFISSYLPEIVNSKNKKILISYIIIFFAYLSLAIWLKFAFHNYCWIPYKNILFN